LKCDEIPRVAVLSSAFFVASLIHVPVGPASAHLLATGLCGMILGWAAFPALLVGLLLQAILFSYGGLTTLGVNTVTMALPAVLCSLLLGPLLRKSVSRRRIFFVGFFAGVLGVAFAAVVAGLWLLTAGEAYLGVIGVILAAHLPIMVVEGLVTGSVLSFVVSVRPALLGVAAHERKG
jgi:cobalt/nickel transport system permease protein